MKTFPITRIDTTAQGDVVLYGPRGSLIVRRQVVGAVAATQVTFNRFETDTIPRPVSPSTTHTVDVADIPTKRDGVFSPSIVV